MEGNERVIEHLQDLLPHTILKIDNITGGSEKCFEATFHISCKTEEEVNTFVANYMRTTKEVLRAATTK